MCKSKNDIVCISILMDAVGLEAMHTFTPPTDTQPDIDSTSTTTQKASAQETKYDEQR